MGVCHIKPYKKDKSQYPFKIAINSLIWNKNSHNLFDFESNQVTKRDIEIDFTGKLVQFDKEIVMLTPNECIQNETQLLNINFNNDSVQIKPVSNTNPEQQLWHVIRACTDDTNSQEITKWQINIGDIMKLGRVTLRVKEFAIIDDNGNVEQSLSVDNPAVETEQSQITGEKPNCRICLSESSTMENPLLRPCQCDGSMKFLHLKCIQRWVQTQLKTKQQGCITLYYWKKLKCELCRQPYKMELSRKVNNDLLTYNIIDIPKPPQSYIMLQIKNNDKNKERGIYCIDLQKKNQVKIGRVQECDIKLNDISVSRHHATIFIEKGNLFIEDNGSKFGTLILLQQTVQLTPKEKKKLSLQCGRTLLSIECKKKQKGKSTQYKAPQNVEILRIPKGQKENENQAEKDIGFNESLSPVEKGAQGPAQLDEIIIYEIEKRDNDNFNSSNVFSLYHDNKEQYQSGPNLNQIQLPRTNAILQMILGIKEFANYIDTYYKGINQDSLLQLCTKLKYKKYQKGNVIFEQGQKSDDNIYLIVSGSILRLVRDMDQNQNSAKQEVISQQPQHFQNRHQAFRGSKQIILDPIKPYSKQSIVNQIPNLQNIINNNEQRQSMGEINQITIEERLELIKKYGNNTKILSVGKLFGERYQPFSNRTDNEINRNYTVVIEKAPTEIIIINEQCIKEIYEKDQREIINNRRDIILHIFKDLQSFSSQGLESILQCFSIEKLSKGAVITRQDVTSDKIYIIEEGDVMIQKEINSKASELCNQYRIKPNTKNLIMISKGQIIGEEIFISKKQNYLYTSIVNSLKCVLLKASKPDLEKKLPQDMREYLVSLVKQKIQQRESMYQEKLHEEQTINYDLKISQNMVGMQYKGESQSQLHISKSQLLIQPSMNSLQKEGEGQSEYLLQKRNNKQNAQIQVFDESINSNSPFHRNIENQSKKKKNQIFDFNNNGQSVEGYDGSGFEFGAGNINNENNYNKMIRSDYQQKRNNNFRIKKKKLDKNYSQSTKNLMAYPQTAENTLKMVANKGHNYIQQQNTSELMAYSSFHGKFNQLRIGNPLDQVLDDLNNNSKQYLSIKSLYNGNRTATKEGENNSLIISNNMFTSLQHIDHKLAEKESLQKSQLKQDQINNYYQNQELTRTSPSNIFKSQVYSGGEIHNQRLKCYAQNSKKLQKLGLSTNFKQQKCQAQTIYTDIGNAPEIIDQKQMEVQI